ncbi:hypothetical protein VTO73DRAFT_7226 [Trametes versicolor]
MIPVICAWSESAAAGLLGVRVISRSGNSRNQGYSRSGNSHNQGISNTGQFAPPVLASYTTGSSTSNITLALHLGACTPCVIFDVCGLVAIMATVHQPGLHRVSSRQSLGTPWHRVLPVPVTA